MSWPAYQLKAASEGSPTTIWPILLGTARYLLGDMPGAKEAFLEAVEQAPDNANHLHKLGALYLEFGEIEPAIRTLGRARLAAPQFPGVHRLLKRAYGARETGSRE